MKIKIIFSFLLFFCFSFIFGQRTINGRVLGEHLEILMEVTIYNKDTTEIGKTDLNGYFKIELTNNLDELFLRRLGTEWTKITIPKNCNDIEVILLSDVIYDFISSNKIDRLRKNRFDKLTKLHSKAYDKGIFKTKEICFNYEFKALKPTLDLIANRSKQIKKEHKKNFDLLKVGDTITIPFSVTINYDESNRTNLFEYSYLVERNNFDCKIKGVVSKKDKNRKGFFLTYKIIETKECEYKSIIFNNEPVEVGQIIEQNIKYSKIITK